MTTHTTQTLDMSARDVTATFTLGGTARTHDVLSATKRTLHVKVTHRDLEVLSPDTELTEVSLNVDGTPHAIGTLVVTGLTFDEAWFPEVDLEARDDDARAALWLSLIHI